MKKHPRVSLKFSSKKVLELCLVLSLAIHMLLFFAFKKFEAEAVFFSDVETTIEVQDIPETEQVKRPPPPSAPAVPIESEDEELLDDITIEETDIDFTTFEELPEPPQPIVEEEEIPPFLPIENQPKMIGGEAALMKVLVYPEIALRAEIEGVVTIQYLVGKDGVPRDFIIAKSLNKACDDAAIAALQQMRFVPATQRDKPVAYRMSRPIRFLIK